MLQPTNAPGIIREVVSNMQKLYPDWKPRPDKTLLPPKNEDIQGFNVRADYLDDIFNPSTQDPNS